MANETDPSQELQRIQSEIQLFLSGLDEEARETVANSLLLSIFDAINTASTEFAEIENRVMEVIEMQKKHSRRPPTKFLRLWNVFKAGNGLPVLRENFIGEAFGSDRLFYSAMAEFVKALDENGVEVIHDPSFQLRLKHR